MKASDSSVSRRQVLAGAGAAAASFFIGSGASAHGASSQQKKWDLASLVGRTPFIDTHEHLPEEDRRTNWKPGTLVRCDDWGLLLSHYLDSDLKVAGMPSNAHSQLTSPEFETGRKWPLLAPYWPHVKNTGYGRTLRIAIERLYGVDDLNAGTAKRVAEGYRKWVKPGFYQTILREHAGVESCQVNSLEAPFTESRQPLLLMQDISILSFSVHSGSNWTWMTDKEGRKATDLAGWHRVIDWCFEKYGAYAVAVKTQAAYSRRLDYADVPAEQAAEPFRKLVANEPVTPEERKLADDHVFWYCVRRATEKGLPIKLHTGYYAGQNSMPMGRVALNPADVSDLLRHAPDTTFVLMHIGYPFQEQTIALAKHYSNAVVDMCWAWIISPTASERFLRDFLVTAPSNRILTFGGDYIPVECVVGHAAIARQGIVRALESLVADSWLTRRDAVDLVDPIMHGNARRIFRLEEKQRQLRQAPWLGS